MRILEHLVSLCLSHQSCIISRISLNIILLEEFNLASNSSAFKRSYSLQGSSFISLSIQLILDLKNRLRFLVQRRAISFLSLRVFFLRNGLSQPMGSKSSSSEERLSFQCPWVDSAFSFSGSQMEKALRASGIRKLEPRIQRDLGVSLTCSSSISLPKSGRSQLARFPLTSGNIRQAIEVVSPDIYCSIHSTNKIN